MRDPDILLTPEEQTLLSQICFDRNSHEEIRNSLAPMEALASSILERGAVPAVRIAYFTDPELNIGGRGKSRQDIFEKNGTSGDEVLRHPHFLKHLKYFIYGPDLPSEAVAKFKSKAYDGHLTGSDVVDLTVYARSCVRQNGLDPYNAAEEFFKLAVECGAMPGFAANLRNSIRAIKLR